jgi:hypothetical protein
MHIALVKSILAFLKKAFMKIRMDGSIAGCLQPIIDNAESYGPSVSQSATDLLTSSK